MQQPECLNRFFSFIEDYNPDQETVNAYINRTKESLLAVFFVGLEKLPFYNIVLNKIKDIYPDYYQSSTDMQRYMFVKTMLDPDKLNFGFYPKGLLPFHKYKEHIATAFEEHLFEAALYASTNNKAHLHYTISEKYKDIFDDEFKKIKPLLSVKPIPDLKFPFPIKKKPQIPLL